MLLHDGFRASAERLPEKVALVAGHERLTYGRLGDLAGRLAGALARRGVVRGDRVAVYLPSSAEAVAAIYGTLEAGAAFIPVNPQTRPAKLAYLLRDAAPAALVADLRLPGWEAAVAEAPAVKSVLLVGGSEPRRVGSAEVVPLAAALAEGAPPPARPGTIDLDLAAIIYTSGSTGDPKGVVFTHRAAASAARSITAYLGLREDDVISSSLPLAFGYGLFQVVMAFGLGARVVLEASFAFPAKVLDGMQRERATVLPGVPTAFATLLGMKSLAAWDLSALRTITTAAAPMPEAHIREVRRLFPGARFFSMYGLTECLRVTYLPPEDLDRKPGSVGRGMPNQEHWLVDESGRRLPPGATGELVVRGSHLMSGYWNRPAETAERLRPGPLPGELVLHTGDLFRTDEEGYLYFVSRRDDVIKSRGEKVAPREVENAICSLPGVREACVLGVPDPILGEAVKACVVRRPGVDPPVEAEDVIRRCQERLEAFMVPKHVLFLAELPTTDTGKVSRRKLRESAAG